jgi:hypothetical protein
LHVLFRWIILSIFDVETINKLTISHINSVNFLYLLEEGLKHRVWEDGMPNWHDMVEGSPQWWSLAIVIAHDRCFYASIVTMLGTAKQIWRLVCLQFIRWIICRPRRLSGNPCVSYICVGTESLSIRGTMGRS